MTGAVRVDIGVLGSTSLRLDGTAIPLGGRRRRQVLARLALGVPAPVGSDRLVEAVWGEDASDRARATLHVHVSNLRQVLRDEDAADLVVTAADGYRLDVTPEAVDANRFARLAEDGLRHVAAGHLLRSRDLLADALAMWGEPFPELADEPDLVVERDRLGRLAERAEDHLIDAELGLGRAAQVVGELEARIAAAPLRETSLRQLVQALLALGRAGDAGRVVVETARRVREEYGVEPSPWMLDVSATAASPGAAFATTRSPEPTDAPGRIPPDVMRPGESVLFVDDDHVRRAAAIDQVALMAQRELRRTIVIRPAVSDTAPWEAVDRAIGPFHEWDGGRADLPDGNRDVLAELDRRAGPGGLVVIADVDRITTSLRSFVQRLVGDAPALGLTVVGTAASDDVAATFGSIRRVDAVEPDRSRRGDGAVAPDHLRDMLLVVALCEPETPIQLLVRLQGLDANVVELLADARNRHLVEDAAPGHVRLTDAGRAAVDSGGLFDDAPRVRRAHLAIAEAIGDTEAISVPRRRAIEARHRLAARPDGDPNAAARAVIAAADVSLGAHLYADALAVLRPAAELVEAIERDDATRARLLERLARTHMRGGRVSDGVEWSRRLIDHARRTEAPVWLAEGVRLLGEQSAPQSLGDELAVLQREALAATLDEPTDTTVQLLTDLAGAVYFDDLEACHRHAEQALVVARQIDHPATIARALTGKMQTLLGPADVGRRLDLAIEAQAMARRAELRHVQVHALTYEVYSLFEQGRLDAVGPPLRYALDLADEVQFGRVEWWVRAWDALRLLATGKFADAEIVARDALERYADPDRRDAFECYGSQLMCARLLTGDGAEIVPFAQHMVDRSPGTLGYRGLLALAAAQAGDDSTAHAQLDASVPLIADLREDATLLSTSAMLAEAAWACERADAAELLLPIIEPYAASHAVLNIWGGGGFYWGPVAHLVGLAQHLTGRGDARAALRAAEHAAEEAGAAPFAQRTRAVLDELG